MVVRAAEYFACVQPHFPEGREGKMSPVFTLAGGRGLGEG